MSIQRKTLLALTLPFLLPTAAAYLQWGLFGLPAVPAIQPVGAEPSGFPAWLRVTHYVNFLFLVLLIRSGLQILADHPRLYWSVHCTPGTEWARFTPVWVPTDRPWTSKQDSRHLSPWIGLPGYRHTVGMARHWHFLSVLFWVGNGVVFVVLLFATGQWRRLVPMSWQVVPDAWAAWVHYATLHLPPEPDGFYRYNALQQLAYFGVVFILAPLAILTGPSMSPALTNRFSWYPRLPGNRQVGRSLHFMVMCGFVLFVVAHVTMVALTGFARNMNHIVVGADDGRLAGVYLGLAGVAVIVAVNALAHRLAWHRPRLVQQVAKVVVTPVMRRLLDQPAPVAEFPREEISPYFWTNGRMPTSTEWRVLATGGFRDYRLRVHGLVEHPLELSLDDLRALGGRSRITLHHCIQGWSGIAQWGGLPLVELTRLACPRPRATRVVFHSFGDGVEFSTGEPLGRYYESLSLADVLHPQSMLAYEMNGAPLPEAHGAPLRLRVENQLGFKMVKWIRAIEFVEDLRSVGEGQGGFAEDHEYFGELANI
ncbi:MAG: molybdopterin-dependent oxidoreductase [Deltaproteobacteria bacterium]|nr:molybdopterin-dependent oxidoreductase [Deltaproteobacteria bacterium]